MSQPVPVDARRTDWPRLVARTVNNLLGRIGPVERLAGRVVTATTTLTDDDRVVLVNASAAAVTINLPAATDGRQYTVKKVDSSSNAVTLDGAGSEKIDGANTLAITAQWAAYTIYGKDGGWWIV